MYVIQGYKYYHLTYLKTNIILKIQEIVYLIQENKNGGFMKTNYMMNANDVAAELGISKGHAYKLIRQLNQELEESGFIVVAGKVPRAFWETRFYGYQKNIQTA